LSRRRGLLIASVVAMFLLIPVGAGRASFPGTNGQIVVAEGAAGVYLDGNPHWSPVGGRV